MAATIYDTTKLRLESYDVFTSDTVESIAQFAKVQAEFSTYQEFFTVMGVGEVCVHHLDNGDGVPVVDIPAQKTPEKGTLVVHAPMGVGLDPNQLYQLATIAGTNPEYRVIGFGNPSGDNYYVKEQELNFWRRLRVALLKDMRPIVAPELDYLQKNGVTRCFQIGYSYGALKAVAESEFMKEGELEGVLLVDPVAKPRNIVSLVRGFKRTFSPLGKYVNATNLKTFHKARADAARGRDHDKALLRPINMTIGVALSRINILRRLRRALLRHPGARAMVAYGTASEFGDAEYIRQRLTGMDAVQGKVGGLSLEGLEHAFANDVHVHAAVVRAFVLMV